MEKYIVEEKDINKRVDIYLSEKIQDISRSKIKSMIDDGDVLINNKRTKASAKLCVLDEIIVDKKDKNDEIMIQDMKLDIVYEDEYVLVVNKPRGMVVHPANGNYENTLVNGLLFHLGDNISKINGEYRAGIVHRIDKDTSGLLVVAKDDYSSQNLTLQLKEHSMKRIYTLICHGIIDEETIIETNIGRNENNRLKYAVVSQGKYAHTTIKPIEIFEKYTYANAVLKTGRTHQIRVHLRHINHPIVGDRVYSNYKEIINGQLLHAGILGFVHPYSKKYMEFSTGEPDIFKKELTKLRKLKSNNI